ncbi:MAG: hypothetical protein COB13_011100 [OCS116 cluster bacterium]|uniref:Uncharacterized protein n=1 Tax=OCS116 cluster bacterium TaxID=2030921 RepID=A0A2A4Z8V9_9PROT|nr:hypothetical protein [OCS116 cluster bacterium]
MRFLFLSLGKVIFQVSIIIFIIGYCFGFWFKSKKSSEENAKLKSPHPTAKLVKLPHEVAAEAA